MEIVQMVCRVQDYHLWYTVVQHALFAISLLLISIPVMIFYNSCKKENDEYDDWMDLVSDICILDGFGDLTYADLKKSSKEKEFCTQ